MERRGFLQSAVGGLLALAGCGGDGDGQTTTTVEADIRSADAGEYGDRLVSLDGADVFLVTYYPAYAQVLEWLPRGGTMNRVEAERAGPTAFAAKENVASYFQGYTRNSETELTYADVRGSFDTGTVASRTTEERGFGAADAGIEGFDAYATEEAALALADDRIVWVESTGGDPVARLEAVLATTGGEREAYTATHEDVALLLRKLRNGHQISVAPSNAGEFGATEYGRQYVFGPDRARPEEVLVFDSVPEDPRTRFEEHSPILEKFDEATIRRVETDGNTAKAVYTTVPNSII